MPGSLVERVRRFFLSSEDLEDTELRERAQGAGAHQLSECRPRSLATLQGTVVSVTSDAKHGWLEAELNDGSGVLRLVWMGRTRLECLLPGRHMRVTGRLAEDQGRPVMYNPEFEILPH